MQLSRATSWPRGERLSRAVALSPFILGVAAFLAIVYFDFGPPLPFNDDWGYAWEAQHTSLNGIERFPTAQATAFFQAVWGQMATLGNPQEPMLRLSLLPFVLLAGLSSYRIARGLGADRVWSGFAGVALLVTPIYLNVATSFMTDVPYVALMLAAADAGVCWARSGSRKGLFLLWVVLATLQRQVGVGLPLALTVALLLGWRQRRPKPSEAVWLAASWAAAIAIVLAPPILGIQTPVEELYTTARTQIHPEQIARGVGYLPAMLGLFLLPFTLGVLFQSRQPRRGRRFSAWSLLTLASLMLGVSGFYAAVTHLTLGDATTGVQVFAGDILSPQGFVPSLGGHKPQVFPAVIWLAIELSALAASVVFFIVRAPTWGRLGQNPGAAFLIVAAAIQAGEVLDTFVFDRYLLAAAALLVPLVAIVASRSTRPRLAIGWAIGTSVVGIVLYGVAQQDYNAWQSARDQALRFVYQFAPPGEVYGGYEPSAVYVLFPEYEQNGYLVDVNGSLRQLVQGPDSPRFRVFFSGPDDPAPGVRYDSIAPGKIIIVGNLPPDAGSP